MLTRDEVGVNVLSAVGLHPVVACRAILDTDPVLLYRRRSVRNDACLL